MNIPGARREQIARQLAEARARDGLAAFVGYLTLYCDNPRCAMREIHAAVKEYDGPTPARLLCPACRRQLKPHAISTREEQTRLDERDARLSVRAQLYEAREILAGRAIAGSVAVPLILNDALPRPEELPRLEPVRLPDETPT